jgi:cytochrome b561
MSPSSYGPIQKVLHWSVFLLVLGLYGSTYIKNLYPHNDPGRAFIWWLHISFGLLLFAFVLLRIALRVGRGAPALPQSMTAMERYLAHGAHLALYGLLLAIPSLGVFLAWLKGSALTFFGLFTIPALVEPEPHTARSIQELHQLAAYLILAFAGCHAAAALWHHFVRRDDVLGRMLPNRTAGSERRG